MKIFFCIDGNQDDKKGNPIPKAKLTKGQQWTPKAQRYVAWKDYVRAAFLDATVDNPEGKTLLAIDGRIKLGDFQRARMHLHIMWADEKHPDPESVFGSIADALFVQDKHLSGSVEFIHGDAETGGKVDVEIEVVEGK